MPFYEYQCRNCGQHLEVLQKISDGPLKKCPSCGRAQLARIMSRVAFRLKGGGWYETDFKSDGESKRNLVGDDKPAGGEAAAVDPTAKADAAVKTEAAPKAEAPAKPEKASRGASKTPAKAAPRAKAKPVNAKAKSKAAKRR